jgi:anti-sigma factor RsiW
MKQVPKSLEDKLFRYLDGALTTDELRLFNEELRQNEVLKERLSQLRDIDRSMGSLRLEEPSRNFTTLVMSKLDQYPLSAPGFSIRNSILLLAGILVAVGIASALVAAGVFDNVTPTLDLSGIALPTRYFQKSLPSIPFNGKIVMDIIIFLNLGLAWIVLDRAILRPLFQRRMQEGH